MGTTSTKVKKRLHVKRAKREPIAMAFPYRIITTYDMINCIYIELDSRFDIEFNNGNYIAFLQDMGLYHLAFSSLY